MKETKEQNSIKLPQKKEDPEESRHERLIK